MLLWVFLRHHVGGVNVSYQSILAVGGSDNNVTKQHILPLPNHKCKQGPRCECRSLTLFIWVYLRVHLCEGEVSLHRMHNCSMHPCADSPIRVSKMDTAAAPNLATLLVQVHVPELMYCLHLGTHT